MFILKKTQTFTTIATIKVPTDDGIVNETMTVRFKLLDGQLNSSDFVAFLREAVLHISDIADDDGNKVLFDSEVLEKVLALPFARVGLFKAYWSALSGPSLVN